MISLLNPNALTYTYIALAVYVAVFAYLAIRRKKFIKRIGLSDNIYWYIIQFAKITAAIILVSAMSMPVSARIYEKHLPLEELNPGIRNILENLTVLHVVIVDESISMLYMDENNVQRSIFAFEFIENYLKNTPFNDIVLIIGFADKPRTICVGKPSYCLKMLGEIKPGRNYTDIVEAVDYAKKYADASQYPSIFVIVSDGAHNRGGDPVETLTSVNKTYPVLFTRIDLDPRANSIVLKLQENGIRVFSMNKYTRLLIAEKLPSTIHDLRLVSFISKRLLEVRTTYEDYDPYPTMLLLITSCILLVASRIEGF